MQTKAQTEYPADVEAIIEERLATGRYHSRSDVILEALYLLGDQVLLEKAKIELLRAEIQKGIDSGPSEPMDMDDVIARGRERHRRTQA